MGKSLTEEDIQNKLHPTLKIDYNTYTDTQHKAKFIDAEYGEFWRTVGDVLRHKQYMHPLRSRAELRLQQLNKVLSKLPSNITLQVDTFVSISKPAIFIHADYGPWEALPLNVISGRSARPRCFITLDYVIKNLPSFITIKPETFVNCHASAVFIDAEYGEFKARPWRVLNGSVHRRRAGLQTGSNRIRSLESVKAALPDFISIKDDTYVSMHRHAVFVDQEYGEFTATPKNVISNGLCHRERYGSRSRGEDDLASFIQSLIRIEQNYRPIKNKELDIYIPDLKIGIEYNGLYWHCDLYKHKTHHFDKRVFFNNLNIQLLQFHSDEWTYSTEIVKSIIRAKLNKSQARYHARKLDLKPVSSQEAKSFLNDNHLMGEYRSAKHVGLFDNNSLISLISYRKHKDGIDISRFCNKLNTSVAGGLSKLLKHIEQTEQPKFIQSWVDLRYGTGDSLQKIGFDHIKTTLGWQWTDFTQTYNRLRCRANMDSRGLTEKQHAEELGWHKIYDAGQALFVKKLK